MLLEILKYTIPALIVFLTAYLILNRLITNEYKKQKVEIVLNNQKIITPIRIQAYERMVLFLERISPQSLVLRSQKPNMTNLDLQNALLRNIRSEFEHNMAHQLYVSDKAWEMVKSAKESLVKIINQNAIRVKPDAPAIQLSKLILEKMMEGDNDPAQKALAFLKSEIRTLF
jgi:CRISPR/Cas system CMR subunit Cmr4 (Cas7 group RAMP superfamily)